MNLTKLLTYVGPIFLVLYGTWFLFELTWWTHLSVCATLAVVAWTLGYCAYDQLVRETVSVPGEKAVLVTGCDTGFGHELAIKLDRWGECEGEAA